MKTFSEFNNINENMNFTNESKSGLEGVIEYKDGLTEEDVQNWLKSQKSGKKEGVNNKPAAGFGQKRTFGKK